MEDLKNLCHAQPTLGPALVLIVQRVLLGSTVLSAVSPVTAVLLVMTALQVRQSNVPSAPIRLMV